MNVKVGDYVAVYSGRGERAKAILVTDVKRMTALMVDLGNGNKYRKDTGRRISYRSSGDFAEKVPKAFHDQFMADKHQERVDKAKRDAEWAAKENAPEHQLTRWIQNECEYRFDSMKSLTLWRLQMAKMLLSTEIDDMSARTSVLEMVP